MIRVFELSLSFYGRISDIFTFHFIHIQIFQATKGSLGVGSLHRMSIEEGASMRKIKPALKDTSQFEHLSSRLRYFFMFLSKFVLWTGLLPIKMVGSPQLYEFKLLSKSSFFAFVRLLIITFPFLILPLIFMFGGFTEREYEEITGEKYQMKIPKPGLKELFEAEFYINFLVYLLPFAFAFAGFEHFAKVYRVQVQFQNMMTLEDKPDYNIINVKLVLFPIIGFLLFAFGKLLNMIYMWIETDFINTGLHINIYTNSCYFVLVHLPLHFLLAMYENFLYQTFNMFRVMCSLTLNAVEKRALVERAKILPGFMEAKCK